VTRCFLVLVLVILVACESRSSGATDSSAAAAAAPPAVAAPMAGVTIVSPAEGDTTGAEVIVVMRAEGVAIEKASGTRADGVGHFHLFVDTAATTDMQVIPPTTKQTIHIGTGDSTFTLTGLTPGPHEVVAVIGYGDHAAMPSRRDTVRFVVRR
jgi:hypothetical protein